MKMTGEDLFFLVQVLRDSLDVEMGSRYAFRSDHESRKKFHDQFIKAILCNQETDIQKIDYSKLKDIN